MFADECTTNMLLLTSIQLLICLIVDAALLERFVIVENLRLPIFGSFSYDPVKQDFDLPARVMNETDPPREVNGNYLSTAINIEGSTHIPEQIPPGKVVFRINKEKENNKLKLVRNIMNVSNVVTSSTVSARKMKPDNYRILKKKFSPKMPQRMRGLRLSAL